MPKPQHHRLPPIMPKTKAKCLTTLSSKKVRSHQTNSKTPKCFGKMLVIASQ